MSKSNEKEEKPKRRFSEEQYEMLLRCSEKKDIKEWEKWRDENLFEDILLECANLSGCYLKSVSLNVIKIVWGEVRGKGRAEVHMKNANLSGTQLQDATLMEAHLEGVNLSGAHLEGATLSAAHLDNADLSNAHMEGASATDVFMEGVNLTNANLKDTCLYNADLENADFHYAHLEGATLISAYLKGAILYYAHLECANVSYAYLEGANLNGTHLEGANFDHAIVDGSTLLRFCTIDRNTDFREVGLDSARIQPGTKALLKYNVRRKNWEEWYKEHWFWRWPVRLFWAMSDYGRSAGRIVGWFFGLALLFAAIYANCDYWCPPGIVSDLSVEPHTPLWHYFLLLLFRPLYFSVVTMTTLGFGDMYANPDSVPGHILLMVQVILGYVLLGALVTRFAVLFTAGGPAGKFVKHRK